MKNWKSQTIIRDACAKVIKGESKILWFITIRLEIRKRDFIKLRFKMKYMRCLIILKIILNTIPSIKSTIIGRNNGWEKSQTNITINPSTNNA